MGSRDLWHDSSFSGREVRGISGRKPKQHIHSFHTYKTDNNNAKASDTAPIATKVPWPFLITLWKPHSSFERQTTFLCISQEKHCVMQDITGAKKPNIVNSVTIQQLRRVQGSSAQAKRRERGIRVLHARGQRERVRRARLTVRRSLSTGHFGKRFVHEIDLSLASWADINKNGSSLDQTRALRYNEPSCSLSNEFDKQLGASLSHWLVTFSPNNHTDTLCA